MATLPETYRQQSGCHNCAHVFRRDEYSDPFYYFCTFNAPPRPICCSVAMDETSDDVGDDPYDTEARMRRQQEWHEWSDTREVEAWGICDNWKASKLCQCGKPAQFGERCEDCWASDQAAATAHPNDAQYVIHKATEKPE